MHGRIGDLAAMTWTQICEQHPDECVALVEIDWVNDTDLTSAPHA